MSEPRIESQSTENVEINESSLIQIRKEKLERIKNAGINPYPAYHEITINSLSTEQIKNSYGSVQTGEESSDIIRLCGRLMTRRDMGKACFAHLQDFEGQLQIYIRKDTVGDQQFDLFSKDMDIGDILGIQGKAFRTKTGELSLKASQLTLLSKSLRPMPEKWHGLKDIELRSRQRELDLIANPDSRKIFGMRSQVIQSLRSILYDKQYLEVETPMMQSIPGGAVARPFETYHNALDQKFYLRVAPELYLKRCLVGGFPKVFEIGRVFRNEGIDSLHNPEFTILEAYQAYGNIQTMMELTEQLLIQTAKNIQSTLFPEDLKFFHKKTMTELFEQYVGKKEAQLVQTQNWEELANRHNNLIKEGLRYKVFDHLFDEKIAEHLIEPTFVSEFPSDFSPLAKCKEGSPHIAERFELYIHGQEIANAYSELNDPLVQRSRLENYHSERTQSREDEEKAGMGLDDAFIQSLEYGMPPAGGLGIGVDRLVMLLTNQKSIRDVVLFPTLKSQPKN